MKRLFNVRLLAVLLVMALVAAACGGDDSGDSPTTTAGGGDATTTTAASGGGDDATTTTAAPMGVEGTIKVLLHQNPPLVTYMEDFNDRFQAANPGVEVDMEIVGAGDINTSAQTRLTANDVDVIDFCGAPCAAFSNAPQPYMSDVDPPLWQQLIDAGLIADLTDEPFTANYDSLALEQAGTYNGRVYALPAGRAAYSGMFVNNDLLAEVGQSIPTTWPELLSVCDAVEAAGNSCMTVGGGDTWPVFVGSWGILGALFPDQAGLVEGLWTGSIKWNDADTLELWEKYQVYATELLEDGVTGYSHDAVPARYAVGDVAFLPAGVWQAPQLEAAEPGFDWTYVPFPGSDDAADNQFLFGKYDMSWMVAENAPNKEAALAYVAALSDPAEYQTYVDAVGFIPTQPGATLNTTLGTAVAPLLDNFIVGFEQVWVGPKGAGEWANGLFGATWFAPYNVWTDPVELANQAQSDLEAGLSS
jgi:raffinose/stachyose/melibiose transport system substrate-binding protein